eukprot:5164579-Amphidinium_carterae.1
MAPAQGWHKSGSVQRFWCTDLGGAPTIRLYRWGFFFFFFCAARAWWHRSSVLTLASGGTDATSSGACGPEYRPHTCSLSRVRR